MSALRVLEMVEDVAFPPAAGAAANQCADHEPHHPVEKTIARNLDLEASSVRADPECFDRAIGARHRLSPVCRERREIMPANKQLRGGCETATVDWRRHVPHPPQLVRWEDAIVPNPVAIRFPDGRISGMKTLPHVGAPQDTNRRGEVRVQSEWPLRCRERPLRQFDMRALRQGMHTGIGATSAVHAQLGTRDRGESLLQVILNCVAAGLALPSGKRCTVIRDDELQPRWHLFGWRISTPASPEGGRLSR